MCPGTGKCRSTLFSKCNFLFRNFSENIKGRTENIKSKTNIQVPSVFSDIQENLAKKFNFQEKRMLKAFPKFKSINYNEVLEDLKEKLKIKRRK